MARLNLFLAYFLFANTVTSKLNLNSQEVMAQKAMASKEHHYGINISC